MLPRHHTNITAIVYGAICEFLVPDARINTRLAALYARWARTEQWIENTDDRPQRARRGSSTG